MASAVHKRVCDREHEREYAHVHVMLLVPGQWVGLLIAMLLDVDEYGRGVRLEDEYEEDAKTRAKIIRPKNRGMPVRHIARHLDTEGVDV